MKFLTRIWNYLRHWIWRREYDAAAEPIPEPKPDPRHSWLPPDVKTNGELRPHLPSRTNRPMRYDQTERARKRRVKGAR